MSGRHVLIVVRGYSYKQDLMALRPYIRDYKPVIIGVDGGADAVMEAGLKPDMIVGDMDSVSDKALGSGARSSFTPTAMAGLPGSPVWSASAPSTRSSRPPVPVRTSPCSWPMAPERSSSSRSART